jgi:ABC-type sugar transport system ATPase subunit
VHDARVVHPDVEAPEAVEDVVDRRGDGVGVGDVEQAIADFAIRPADGRRVMAELSGGNQQKVVLARWMLRAPRVLVLDEPFQGVDVGAKAEIEALLRAAAAGGLACLVVDSDFEDLARLCDRVLVLRDGAIGGELRGAALTADALVEAVFADGATPVGVAR